MNKAASDSPSPGPRRARIFEPLLAILFPLLVCLLDRKSTRLNSSHLVISYAVFCLKKKKELSYALGLALPCPQSPTLRNVILLLPGTSLISLHPPLYDPASIHDANVPTNIRPAQRA